jgi:hypothetical protein
MSTDQEVLESEAEVPAPTPRTCISCIYVLGSKRDVQLASGWKCTHPKNIASKSLDLISGEIDTVYNNNITDCRYNICEGNWWEEYKAPTYSPLVPQKTIEIPGISKKRASQITLLDL